MIWDQQVDSPGLFGSVNTFTSDGSTITFSLTGTPVSLNSMNVSINGVTQIPGTNYTLSGQTLTLSSAAPIYSVIAVQF